jgi:hypothetical protein
MEVGGAMSSPRRCQWRAAKLDGGWACARGRAEDWFLYPRKVGWELVGSRRLHMHAWRGHSMAGDVRRSGGQWRATGGAPGRWIGATWHGPLAPGVTGEFPPSQRSDRWLLRRLGVRAQRGYDTYDGVLTWLRATSQQSALRCSKAISIR